MNTRTRITLSPTEIAHHAAGGPLRDRVRESARRAAAEIGAMPNELIELLAPGESQTDGFAPAPGLLLETLRPAS
jgi:hypothetical protein